MLLRGLKLRSVETGMLLCAAKSVNLSNHYKAKIYFLSRSEGGRKKPIVSKYSQQMFSGTWNVACRIDLGEILYDFFFTLYPGYRRIL